MRREGHRERRTIKLQALAKNIECHVWTEELAEQQEYVLFVEALMSSGPVEENIEMQWSSS